jgi:hypothetical protein
MKITASASSSSSSSASASASASASEERPRKRSRVTAEDEDEDEDKSKQSHGASFKSPSPSTRTNENSNGTDQLFDFLLSTSSSNNEHSIVKTLLWTKLGSDETNPYENNDDATIALKQLLKANINFTAAIHNFGSVLNLSDVSIVVLNQVCV